MTITAPAKVDAGKPNVDGYRSFRLGEFKFSRDEYFAYVEWPTGKHVMSADAFLKALQRDVAWQFFYGIVNFDGVVGTVNHYGTVDLFAGRYNDVYRKAELDHLENFSTPLIKATFEEMLDDWTNDGFDAAGLSRPPNRGESGAHPEMSQMLIPNTERVCCPVWANVILDHLERWTGIIDTPRSAFAGLCSLGVHRSHRRLSAADPMKLTVGGAPDRTQRGGCRLRACE